MYRLLWNISWGLQAVQLLYSCYYFLVALFGLRPQKTVRFFRPKSGSPYWWPPATRGR